MITFDRRVTKVIGTLGLLCISFSMLISTAYSQSVPELNSAINSAELPSSARFYGGVRSPGEAYSFSFNRAEQINLDIKISPEAAHVGSEGTILLVAFLNSSTYTINAESEWVPLEPNFSNLGGIPQSSLEPDIELSIADIQNLFNDNEITPQNDKITYRVYIGYQAELMPGMTYFTQIPLQFTVADTGLPELPGPSTLLPASTTSHFYGGARIQGKNEYASVVNKTESVSLTLGFAPETNHIGSVGSAIVVAAVGNALYTQQNSKDWVVFDGTPEGLRNAENFTSMDNYHQLDITNLIELVNADGVESVDDIVSIAAYMGYTTNLVPGQLYFSGTPLTLSVDLSDSGSVEVFELFQSTIEQQVIQAKCVVCHIAGGVANASALHYTPTSATSAEFNFSVLQTYVNGRKEVRDLILSKASGGDVHTGGIQLPIGSSDYSNMAVFLDALVSGATNVVVDASEYKSTFFNGLTLESKSQTLRRAAIRLAGTIPGEAELALAANETENDLRSAIRNQLQGPGFHDFLLIGSNDKLHTLGLLVDARLIRECMECFPVYASTLLQLEKAQLEHGNGNPQLSFDRKIDSALKNGPMELIAHVVENDRPYSEILTADYMMMTPLLNDVFGGTAEFNNPDDTWEYQPGKIQGMYLVDSTSHIEYDSQFVAPIIVDPGTSKQNVPHAGVLSSRAFLSRYPTTPTNRNRARSRWTYYHFLGIDIEASAQRTTDPDALADTNNPTMFNLNCTICHARLDPVAGVFQNYAEQGQYRRNYGGMDSLDEFYKNPEDGSQSLYQEGDTWYRDMREPGYNGNTAPNAENSLQWLAQEIVQDPGFPSATVKFWWEQVFSAPLIPVPEVVTDPSYQEQLIAFDAQNETIELLAQSFVESGMNLKDLLVEMAMTPWFRTASVNAQIVSETDLKAHKLAHLGNENLLTGEQLYQKTRAVTGFGWRTFWGAALLEKELNQMSLLYGRYYGGIDSKATIKRNRVMTPLMRTVATRIALDSACPIVLREFIIPDGQRKLFNGIEELTTPENGEDTIRAKIAELHFKFLGKNHDPYDSEITQVYNLFADSWTERRLSQVEPHLFNSTGNCDWAADINFGKGLGYDGQPLEEIFTEFLTKERRWTPEFVQFIGEEAADPLHVKQAWTAVITYLMTHYDYLYD